MKLTVWPNGAFEVKADSVDEILAVFRGVRQDRRENDVPQRIIQAMSEGKEIHIASRSVGKGMMIADALAYGLSSKEWNEQFERSKAALAEWEKSFAESVRGESSSLANAPKPSYVFPDEVEPYSPKPAPAPEYRYFRSEHTGVEHRLPADNSAGKYRKEKGEWVDYPGDPLSLSNFLPPYGGSCEEFFPEAEATAGVVAEPKKKPETVREWLETLPDGYRERAIANMSAQRDDDGGIRPSLHRSIAGAFSWDGSPEGWEFWNGVHNHFRDGSPLPALPETVGVAVEKPEPEATTESAASEETTPVEPEPVQATDTNDGFRYFKDSHGLKGRWKMPVDGTPGFFMQNGSNEWEPIFLPITLGILFEERHIAEGTRIETDADGNPLPVSPELAEI